MLNAFRLFLIFETDDAVACLSQNETHLASGSWDSTVKLWSWTPSGLARDPLLTVFDHDTQVNCVELYDSLVLSGGENGTIALHGKYSKRRIEQM